MSVKWKVCGPLNFFANKSAVLTKQISHTPHIWNAPIIARRGDAELFMKFLEFYHEEDCYEEHFQESLAEAAKYGQLKILQKATSKNVSLVNEESNMI